VRCGAAAGAFEGAVFCDVSPDPADLRCTGIGAVLAAVVPWTGVPRPVARGGCPGPDVVVPGVVVPGPVVDCVAAPVTGTAPRDGVADVLSEAPPVCGALCTAVPPASPGDPAARTPASSASVGVASGPPVAPVASPADVGVRGATGRVRRCTAAGADRALVKAGPGRDDGEAAGTGVTLTPAAGATDTAGVGDASPVRTAR
jgi:hypothetical protein